jgi:hypothetical protein
MANGGSGTGRRAHTMDTLNHVFSKLCEINSCHFNYAACTFGSGTRKRKKKKKNNPLLGDGGGGGGDADSLVEQMQAALLAHNKGVHRKEDSDAVSDWKRIKEEAGKKFPEGMKDGAGRVCIAKEFGVVHAYTIEASCNVSQASAAVINNGCLDLFNMSYTMKHFHEVGRAIVLALLEMNGRSSETTSMSPNTVPCPPVSCLRNTRFRSINEMVYAFRTQKNPSVKTKKLHPTEEKVHAFLSHMKDGNDRSNCVVVNSRNDSISTGRSGASNNKMATSSGNSESKVDGVRSNDGGMMDGMRYSGRSKVRAKLHQQLMNGSLSSSLGAKKSSARNKLPSTLSPVKAFRAAMKLDKDLEVDKDPNKHHPGITTFGAARLNGGFSNRYRILAGAPTTYSSGGGFIRGPMGERTSLTNVGRGWGADNNDSSRSHRNNGGTGNGSDGESRRRNISSSPENYKNRSNLSLQLAEARAHLLADEHTNTAFSSVFNAAAPALSRTTRSASARLSLSVAKHDSTNIRQRRKSKSSKIHSRKPSHNGGGRNNRRGKAEKKGTNSRNRLIPNAPTSPKLDSNLNSLQGAQPRMQEEDEE